MGRGFGEGDEDVATPFAMGWILGWRGVVEGGEWRAFQ
jgi:hypothetical protein